MTKILLSGLICTGASFCAQPGDDNWPQFRGPGGLGLGDDQASLPSEFGPDKALLWKTELPVGHGSPCIWGNRIFVTGFDPDTRKLEVIAVERKSGKIAWRQTVPAKELEPVHAVSSPASPVQIVVTTDTGTIGERGQGQRSNYDRDQRKLK